jgi:hypothetical protein
VCHPIVQYDASLMPYLANLSQNVHVEFHIRYYLNKIEIVEYASGLK